MGESIRERTDVLIVGGGPAGLVSALFLSKLGISSIVLERNPVTDEHPKAHELNARSAEILREIGITDEDLAAEASPLSDGSRVMFCRRVNEEIGRIDLMADPERAEKYRRHLRSELPYFNLSQSEFEKILVERVQRAPLAELRFQHKWESMEAGSEHVVSQIRCEQTGEAYEVESRYVIAANGASSPCRRAVGIEMEGPAEIQNFMNAYFQLNLRDHVEVPAKLYWILHPTCTGAFIAHHIDKRWVYAVPLYTPYDTAEDYPPEVLKDRIRKALNYEGDVEITSTTTWRMSAQIAQRYREGCVFLVGDSAHRFPPTGGLGMNTGIPDAQNLCWKLAEVMKGRASDALLDTYEAERRPVAQRNCEESRLNYEKVFEVFEAMGLSGSAPETLAKVVGNRAGRLLPASVRRAVRNFISWPADFLVRRSINNPAVKERVGRAIDDQIGHFDRLGLDIGYCYEKGAVISDGSHPPALENEVADYAPSCVPGVRLPHVWLERDGELCSTHDLLAFGRFTLITNTTDEDWSGAARHTSQRFGVEIKTVNVGHAVIDREGEWARISELESGGAVLVRPDGHVAWRTKVACEDPSETLGSILGSLLGREPARATAEQPAGVCSPAAT